MGSDPIGIHLVSISLALELCSKTVPATFLHDLVERFGPPSPKPNWRVNSTPGIYSLARFGV
jgi:hypothetical protein